MNTQLIEKFKAAASTETMDLTWGKSTEFDLEQYTKLVIKECTDLLREVDWAYDLSTTESPNEVAMMAATDIEVMFGIEVDQK